MVKTVQEVHAQMERKTDQTTRLEEEDPAEAQTTATTTEEVPAENLMEEKRAVISHNMVEALMEEIEEGNQEEMTNGQIEEAQAD